MTPTPKLRFVERSIPMHPFYKNIDANGNFVQAVQKVRILQQWWETNEPVWDGEKEEWSHKGEWRDVPVEKE